MVAGWYNKDDKGWSEPQGPDEEGGKEDEEKEKKSERKILRRKS